MVVASQIDGVAVDAVGVAWALVGEDTRGRVARLVRVYGNNALLDTGASPTAPHLGVLSDVTRRYKSPTDYTTRYPSDFLWDVGVFSVGLLLT